MEEFIYVLAAAWNLDLETIPRFLSYFRCFPRVTEWVPFPILALRTPGDQARPFAVCIPRSIC